MFIFHGYIVDETIYCVRLDLITTKEKRKVKENTSCNGLKERNGNRYMKIRKTKEKLTPSMEIKFS